jgi:hypothetical protein
MIQIGAKDSEEKKAHGHASVRLSASPHGV